MSASKRATGALVLVVSILATLCWGAVTADLAVAGTTEFCPSALYEGDDMRTVGCDSWRQTWVINPGQHHLLDWPDLWRYQAMFNSQGFTDNYLWYSHKTTRTFREGPDSGVKWASCKNESGGTWPPPDHEFPAANDGRATGLCTDRIVAPADQAHSLLASFERPVVTLDVFSYADGSFIVRACGNFSTAPTVNPVPKISGTKYHDRNRNGQRDASEQGLGGWRVRLIRDSSALQPAQASGIAVMETVTAPDGSYSFDLWEQGPGSYHVEELLQDGWVQTAAPAPVVVGFGVGSHNFRGNDLGNVEDRADVVKLAWDVVASPETVHARDTTTVTVRASVTNNGPAPEVDIVDTMTAQGPADCMISPPQHAVTRRLRLGEVVEINFDVDVTCADPSFHRFVFDNRLTVVGPPTDPDDSNNARSTSTVIAVIDDADIGVSDPGLTCPARTDVHTTFRCTGTAVVTNHGPYGPASTDVTLTPTVPADCVVVDGATRAFPDLLLPVATPTQLIAAWTIQCEDRSFHPVSMDAVAALNHLHVQDLEPANDSTSVGTVVEVFEAADLSIARPMRIACGGRLPTITSFGCDVALVIGNGGPAPGVATLTTVSLSAPSDCTVTPTPQQARNRLDAGATAALTFHFDVSCTLPVLHTLLARAEVAADEPHAEDRDLTDNTARVRWVPSDAKPGSEPSSVNVSKEGVVPVAILSTPTFDAYSEVMRSSLRYGVTGFEPSLVSCGGTAEDTNGDTYGDLVCRFDATLAGFTCATTEAVLTGVLADDTPFESQDPVNIVGCKR